MSYEIKVFMLSSVNFEVLDLPKTFGHSTKNRFNRKYVQSFLDILLYLLYNKTGIGRMFVAF